jgi:alkylated DNA repair protein alkB homolog 7
MASMKLPCADDCLMISLYRMDYLSFSLSVFRRRYEQGHWDAVITGYKELELHDIDSFTNQSVIRGIFERTRQHLSEHHLHDDDHPIQWLPCHAIDLKREGELKAHVDSVRFSGGLVAGISLLSSCIMRLIPDNGAKDNDDDDEDPADKETATIKGHIDLLLPPNSLYSLTGEGRFNYSHELLADSSIFTNPIDGTTTLVNRDHRLSIIFRDAKS